MDLISSLIFILLALIVGSVAGYLIRKKIAEAKISSAEELAKQIVEEGRPEDVFDNPQNERTQAFLSRVLAH